MGDGVHEQEEPDDVSFFDLRLAEFEGQVRVMVDSDLFHTDPYSAALLMIMLAATAAAKSSNIGEGDEEATMLAFALLARRV